MHETRTGFALAVVVFLLFAIGMASATGYTVVALESDMSVQGEEATEASTIARAGLQRYFGEHLGIPDDTTSYAIGNGTVYVSARMVAPVDTADGINMYLVTARAEVANLSGSQAPASATVQQFAKLHEEPIARVGAFTASYSSVQLRGITIMDGRDYSYGQCADSGGEDLYAVGHRGSVSLSSYFGNSPTIVGIPSNYYAFSDHAEVYDTAGVRWDILQDSDFPVDYHNVFPNFGALPSDEYPVVRVSGNLSPTSTHSGRGVLIVTGTLTFGNCCFSWDGIVMAGNIGNQSGFWGYGYIRGMLIGGLDGTRNSVNLNVLLGPRVYYDVCSALSASNALAYWEPLEDTFEEIQ